MMVQMKISCNASVLYEDANANVCTCNASVLHEDANANVCASDVYACDAWICPSMILWM